MSMGISFSQFIAGAPRPIARLVVHLLAGLYAYWTVIIPITLAGLWPGMIKNPMDYLIIVTFVAVQNAVCRLAGKGMILAGFGASAFWTVLTAWVVVTMGSKNDFPDNYILIACPGSLTMAGVFWCKFLAKLMLPTSDHT